MEVETLVEIFTFLLVVGAAYWGYKATKKQLKEKKPLLGRKKEWMWVGIVIGILVVFFACLYFFS